MSELERHLLETIEMESLGKVELRYSSPSGVHFAVLQMLQGHQLLDLLVLESTSEVPNNVYRRIGVLTLRVYQEQDIYPPDVLAKLKGMENSLTARLGPRELARREYKLHKVFVEVTEETWQKGTHWKEQTVVII